MATATVSIRIEEALKEHLRMAAEREGKTLSDFCAQVLERHLALTATGRGGIGLDGADNLQSRIAHSMRDVGQEHVNGLALSDLVKYGGKLHHLLPVLP